MVAVSEEARQLYNRATTSLRNRKDDLAKSYALAALDIDPNYVAVMDFLAGFYRKKDKIDSTIYYYEQSLDVFPRNLEAHQNLAAAYLINEEFEQAIEQYKNLLKYYPGFPEAYYGLARVYINLARYQEGLRSSEYAMKLYENTARPKEAAEARELLAQCYLNLDENEKAIKYFKANRRFFHQKPFHHYYIGLAYLKSSKAKKAEESFAKAEEMGYDVPEHIKNRLAFLLEDE